MKFIANKEFPLGSLIRAAAQARGSGSSRKEDANSDPYALAGISRGTAFLNGYRECKARMDKGNGRLRIRIGLGLGLVAALTGCVGYVDGGYGAAAVVPAPDLYFYGGSFERGREVHDYSHRGFESRAVAGREHPVVRSPERRQQPARPNASSSSHPDGGRERSR
jgi:hypothetical protein